MATRDMNTKIWGFIGILVIAAWLLGSVTDAMAVKGEELDYKGERRRAQRLFGVRRRCRG